jgi:hypothetical protein
MEKFLILVAILVILPLLARADQDSSAGTTLLNFSVNPCSMFNETLCPVYGCYWCAGSCQASCPTPVPEGPSGGVQTPPSMPTIKTNFTLSVKKIEERLNVTESRTLSLTINNTGEKDINLTIKSEGDVKPWISFDRDKLLLKVGESDKINLQLLASSIPGIVYTGNITVKGDGLEVKIPVTLIVLSKLEKLLDVKIEMIEEFKNVYPEEDVCAQISIYNFGTLKPIDASIEYGISKDNETILVNKETLAIETSASKTECLAVPENISSGKYNFFVTAVYDSKKATSYTNFNVLKVKPKLHSYIYVILVFVLGLVILILILKQSKYFVRKIYTEKSFRRNRKRRHQLVIIAYLNIA